MNRKEEIEAIMVDRLREAEQARLSGYVYHNRRVLPLLYFIFSFGSALFLWGAAKLDYHLLPTLVIYGVAWLVYLSIQQTSYN